MNVVNPSGSADAGAPLTHRGLAQAVTAAPALQPLALQPLSADDAAHYAAAFAFSVRESFPGARPSLEVMTSRGRAPSFEPHSTVSHSLAL